MGEPLPLAVIQDAVLEFLRGHDARLVAAGADAVVLSTWAHIVGEKVSRERDGDEFR